ncbi:39S ribosomal protein L53, mitochondrial [Folsomia candida]|uniref:39S ribosomal protein L53, mitochondrial n=1 Tax=Folsomia candida TaxID=158441 RepID=UPI000B8F2D40|nr:39S ribosomal protein L53, mitochondrial [Folsomia candida]
MSIYRCSGLVRKPSGLIHEIIHQLKVVDLRPVQRIEYKFDPFHQSAKHVRDLSFWLSSPKIRDTNFKCVFKTSVLSNLSPPEIHCKLDNGKELIFKAENLSLLEILEEFNKIVHPLLPPPEVTTAPLKTKSQKKK